jgi:predicted LPLAT superfamily acyltransferase
MAGEFEYIMKISEKLEAGKWVAVVGKEIVAMGDNGKEVFEVAKRKYPKKEPFIMKVPDGSLMLI